MPTAIYLRKSRADSEDESVTQTLARHSSTLTEFAREHDLDIARVYEEVVSGDSLMAREQMLRLLRDAEAGLFDSVLCMDIDRLGRGNMRDMGLILETLKQAGVRIITPRKTYDLSDEVDEFTTEMQTFIARQELKSIVRRMKQGTKKSVAEGCHVAEPPYGYRRERVGKKSTLRMDGHEAEVVRAVYDWYVNGGVGTQIIADRLNAAGIAPRRGARFSRSTVRFMLSNPTYTGKIVWNRSQMARPKGAGKIKTRPRPESEWIVADGLHPAIIDARLFERAQAIRAGRSHPSSNTGELKNPLAGLLYCGGCGAPMTRQALKKKYNSPRMLCPTRGCARSARVDLIEAAIMGALRARIGGIAHDIAPAAQSPAADTERERAWLAAERRTIAAQRSRLHDLLEQGVYTPEVFAERAHKLAERERACADGLDRLDREREYAARQDDAPQKIDAVLRRFDEFSPERKNALLKAAVSRVYYWKDKSQRDGDFSLRIVLADGL